MLLRSESPGREEDEGGEARGHDSLRPRRGDNNVSEDSQRPATKDKSKSEASEEGKSCPLFRCLFLCPVSSSELLPPRSHVAPICPWLSLTVRVTVSHAPPAASLRFGWIATTRNAVPGAALRHLAPKKNNNVLDTVSFLFCPSEVSLVRLLGIPTYHLTKGGIGPKCKSDSIGPSTNLVLVLFLVLDLDLDL